MSAVAEVFISAVELLEAQAQKLGSSVRTLALSLVVIVAGGLVLLAGVGWLLAAGYLVLLTWLPPAGAAAVMGLLSLAVAGGAIWYAMRKR